MSTIISSTQTERESQSRPRRMTQGARRAQLLEVGRGMFAENGYLATSLDAVARKAGVTKPVLYQHFPNKQAFHDAVAQQEIRELVDRVAAVMSGRIDEMMQSTVQAFYAYVDERPDGFASLASHTSVSCYGDGFVNRERRKLNDFIIEAVKDRLHLGGQALEEAAAIVHGILGMHTFAAQWWTQSRSIPRERMAALMSKLAWGGVSAFIGEQAETAPGSKSGGRRRE